MSMAPGPMMPPQGGQGQISPQLLQLLMSMRGGAPQGAPVPGQGMPPQMAQRPPMPPQGAPMAAPQAGPMPGAPMPQGGPQMAQPPGPPQFTPQQMASMGRFGDRLVAHLTPGEVEIPPEIQTPHLMTAIRQAFMKAGVNPAQFTAGSPQSSRNPATGAPEYNLFSSFLPMALGGLGAFFAPELLPMLGASGAFAGSAGGAALAGGLGSAAGRAMTGGNLTQDLMAGAGGAAGGYLGGGSSLGGSSLTPGSGPMPGATAPASAAGGIPSNAAVMNNIASAASPFTGANALGGGLGAAAGGGLGTRMAPNQPSGGPQLPSGFNTPMPPLNPNFGQLLGSNQANRPSFAGYNPTASVAGPNPGYNFFPVQSAPAA